MKHKYLKDVTTLAFDVEKCVGCGRCTEVCPHGVFDTVGGKACVTNKDACMECGACALNCHESAISVNAGTGCAAAIIMSWVTGKEPSCGPSCGPSYDGESSACCG